MATSPIVQLRTGQRIMGGIGIFQPHDSAKIFKFGPVGTVDLAPTLTEIESRSDESGSSQLIGSWVTQQDGVITISDMQIWTPSLYEGMFLAKRVYQTQTAVASATLVVEDVAVGDVIELPGVNPTITSILDETPTTPKAYLEDEDGTGDGHYIFQSQRKLIEFTAIPASATADATITYALPAITEAAKIIKYEIMKTSGIRGKFSLLGVTGGSLPGQAVDYIFPDVEFRPNGNINLKGVDALNVGSLTGKVYAVDGSYGFVRPVVAG